MQGSSISRQYLPALEWRSRRATGLRAAPRGFHRRGCGAHVQLNVPRVACTVIAQGERTLRFPSTTAKRTVYLKAMCNQKTDDEKGVVAVGAPMVNICTTRASVATGILESLMEIITGDDITLAGRESMGDGGMRTTDDPSEEAALVARL